MYHFRYLVVVLLECWVLIFVSNCLHGQQTEMGGWQISQSGQVFDQSDWIDQKIASVGLDLVPFYSTLGQYDGNPKRKGYEGTIMISPYVIDGKLTLYLGGPLRHPKIELFVEDLLTQERLILHTTSGVRGVGVSSWTFPRSWQGREVAIIANDTSSKQDVWVGISGPIESIPRSLSWGNTQQLYESLLDLLVPLLIYLLIGVSGYSFLVRLWPNARSYMVILVSIFPLTVSYPLFYLAIESLFLFYILGVIVIVVSVVYFLLGGVRLKHFLIDDLRYFIPVLVMVLFATIIANSVLHTNSTPHNPIRLAQEYFINERLPLDNYLPLLTLDRLYDQESLKPFIIEWKSTDRPPLQAAVCLLLRPLFIDPINGYQVFSSWLQASILLGVAFVLQGLKVRLRTTLILCGSILFSGTYLLNTAFVWPKLYAVLFPLFLSGLMLRNKRFEADFGFWVIVGSVSAISLLIHPGSFFALVPILFIYTIWHRKLCWQQFAAAAIVFVLWMLPWLIYQKTYDPPGNIMQKRFFANYPYKDDVSFREALKIGFGQLTFEKWVSGRWENFKVIVGDFSRAFRGFGGQLFGKSETIRVYAFNFIGPSLFPLLLGYLLAPFGWFKIPNEVKRYVHFLHWVVFLGLFSWAILILPIGRTIIHHGSYYFPVVIMLLSGLLVQHQYRLLMPLFFVQLIFYQFVWATPGIRSILDGDILYNIDIIDWGAIGTYTFSLLGVLFLIFKTPDHVPGRDSRATPELE